MRTLLEKLEKALGYGGGQSQTSRHGAQVLERLSRPVQVAVVGRAGCGKSSLIDMILGSRALASHKGQPRIEVAYGEAATVCVDMRGEQETAFAGVLSRNEEVPRSTAVRQLLPDERLKRFNLLEVPLIGSWDDQLASLCQVVEHADIILWCTDTFDTDEQNLWSTVPDVKKDHSFLVLTKADQHLMRGSLAALMARLDQVAVNEFFGIFPVASLQALAAKSGASGANAQLWASSGGRQFHEALMNQVELGRSADEDLAEVLLHQLACPTSETAPSPQPDGGRITEFGQASRANTTGASPDALLRQVLDLIQRQAEEMKQSPQPDGQIDTETMMSLCVDTALGISAILGPGPSENPVLAAARRDAAAAEELVLLMQLERSDTSALDAVKLLLQLKREFTEYLEPADAPTEEKQSAQK